MKGVWAVLLQITAPLVRARNYLFVVPFVVLGLLIIGRHRSIFEALYGLPNKLDVAHLFDAGLRKLCCYQVWEYGVIPWSEISEGYLADGTGSLKKYGAGKDPTRVISYILLISFSLLFRLDLVHEFECLNKWRHSPRPMLRRLAAIFSSTRHHIMHLWQSELRNDENANIALFHICHDKLLGTGMDDLLTADHFGKAKSAYEEILQVEPVWAYGYYGLAHLELSIGRSDHSRAAARHYCDLTSKVNTKPTSVLMDLIARRNEAAHNRTPMGAGGDTYHEFPVINGEAMAKTKGVKILRSMPALECDVQYKVYSQGTTKKIEKTIHLPSRHGFSFDDAVICGTAANGLIFDNAVYSNEGLAYPKDHRAKIFTSRLLTYDGKNAIVRDNLISETIYDAILLPGMSGNYFHFLFDVVGGLAFLPDGFAKSSYCPIIYGGTPHSSGNDIPNFHKEILSLIGLDHRRVKAARHWSGILKIKNGATVSYPSAQNIAHPAVCQFLRQELGVKERSPISKRRLYLARTKGRLLPDRKINNAKNLMKQFGYQPFYPEEFSVKEQIEQVSQAESIICDTGAGMANLVFAPEGCKIAALSTRPFFRDTFTPILKSIAAEYHLMLFGLEQFHPLPILLWSDYRPDFDATDLENVLCAMHPGEVQG